MIKVSNSPLIDGILLTNNCTSPRNHKIDRITPHYMAWYTSAETCCESFVPSSRRASANYCIGKDGEIWLNVEEKNRAWTTGSAYNDNRAITIECANYTDSVHVYGQLPDATWDSLVRLCADICIRNDIGTLNYTGNDNGNLTKHCWYQSTDCPGPWFTNQFKRLANEVNSLIIKTLQNGSSEMEFIFRPDGENRLIYFGGGILHPLSEPKEVDVIQEAYRKTMGSEIPMIELGKKGDDWGNRFIRAMSSKRVL